MTYWLNPLDKNRDKLCSETMMYWMLKDAQYHWENKEHVLMRIEEGYNVDTMIYIYESRVDMFACSIEADILDVLKSLKRDKEEYLNKKGSEEE